MASNYPPSYDGPHGHYVVSPPGYETVRLPQYPVTQDGRYGVPVLHQPGPNHIRDAEPGPWPSQGQQQTPFTVNVDVHGPPDDKNVPNNRCRADSTGRSGFGDAKPGNPFDIAAPSAPLAPTAPTSSVHRVPDCITTRGDFRHDEHLHYNEGDGLLVGDGRRDNDQGSGGSAAYRNRYREYGSVVRDNTGVSSAERQDQDRINREQNREAILKTVDKKSKYYRKGIQRIFYVTFPCSFVILVVGVLGIIFPPYLTCYFGMAEVVVGAILMLCAFRIGQTNKRELDGVHVEPIILTNTAGFLSFCLLICCCIYHLPSDKERYNFFCITRV